MPATQLHHPASYRDPSGFIFEKDGIIYRQVNISYKEHYDHFIQSGYYQYCIGKEWLLPHEEVTDPKDDDKAYKIIRPQRIPLISYPSEWSFDMLKDAALLTLRLAKEALTYEMMIKDATPYNIQWHQGKLMFIDTLSFPKYEESPWIAYRQFCESFLGPLLLMHYNKAHLSQLFLAWPNGIPVQMISALLPAKSRLSLHVYLHIHLHAKYAAKKQVSARVNKRFPKQKLLNLLASLELLTSKLKVPAQKTNWSAYYEEAAQRNDYLAQKKKIIGDWTSQLPVKTGADLGANEGEFSRLLAEKNIRMLSADFDPQCINNLYNSLKGTAEKNIQPFILDLAQPTPAIGVNNTERSSFIQRTKVDIVLALALIHHLSIDKNIPFSSMSWLFSRLCNFLVIEFVPKEDEKIMFMLSQKKDIFDQYNESSFRSAFEQYFVISDRKEIPGSGRVLYLMKNQGI